VTLAVSEIPGVPCTLIGVIAVSEAVKAMSSRFWFVSVLVKTRLVPPGLTLPVFQPVNVPEKIPSPPPCPLAFNWAPVTPLVKLENAAAN